MRILLTGANGYIGMRLLPVLLDEGHEVVCLVRDARRFPADQFKGIGSGRLDTVEGDLLAPESLPNELGNIDAAYYLVHSMGSGKQDFYELEERAARHFLGMMEPTGVQQIVYLTGIVNHPSEELSLHLRSRLNVEDVLRSGPIPVTVLRAAIIVGAGSASFEILRDLVEKLPIMIAPRWLRTPCQPIAVRNVIDYLTGVLDLEAARDETFDIAGPDTYCYADLLLRFAAVRGLRRIFIPAPLITPRLSSYWLYFMTSTSFPLARSLVNSLTHDMSATNFRIREILPLDLIPYDDAVRRAFSMIAQNQVKSSWIDSVASGRLEVSRLRNIEVPEHGVLTDRRVVPARLDPDIVAENFWRIGGRVGWYSMDWAWKLRGWIDRLFGGTGLRRGRRHPTELTPGDALDFWRVLVADRSARRLVLFAEMRLPGEAWLEFRVEKTPGSEESEHRLVQVATFRPRGLLGRAYWFTVLPFHHFVFRSMAHEIATRIKPAEVDGS